jgi:hypothetical protein
VFHARVCDQVLQQHALKTLPLWCCHGAAAAQLRRARWRSTWRAACATSCLGQTPTTTTDHDGLGWVRQARPGLWCTAVRIWWCGQSATPIALSGGDAIVAGRQHSDARFASFSCTTATTVWCTLICRKAVLYTATTSRTSMHLAGGVFQHRAERHQPGEVPWPHCNIAHELVPYSWD